MPPPFTCSIELSRLVFGASDPASRGLAPGLILVDATLNPLLPLPLLSIVLPLVAALFGFKFIGIVWFSSSEALPRVVDSGTIVLAFS